MVWGMKKVRSRMRIYISYQHTQREEDLSNFVPVPSSLVLDSNRAPNKQLGGSKVGETDFSGGE